MIHGVSREERQKLGASMKDWRNFTDEQLKKLESFDVRIYADSAGLTDEEVFLLNDKIAKTHGGEYLVEYEILYVRNLLPLLKKYITDPKVAKDIKDFDEAVDYDPLINKFFTHSPEERYKIAIDAIKKEAEHGDLLLAFEVANEFRFMSNTEVLEELNKSFQAKMDKTERNKFGDLLPLYEKLHNILDNPEYGKFLLAKEIREKLDDKKAMKLDGILDYVLMRKRSIDWLREYDPNLFTRLKNQVLKEINKTFEVLSSRGYGGKSVMILDALTNLGIITFDEDTELIDKLTA